MTELTYKQKCFIWASNFYLYEELDDDYFELSQEDQHKHLDCRAWEPFEYYDGYKLEEFIDTLAEHIIQKVYPIASTKNET